MSTEYAGITIIVDQGAKRWVINIPKAEDVETFVIDAPVTISPGNLFAAVDDPFWSRPIQPPAIGFRFRPVGEYTIREEANPMHTPAPDLSEHEQAEVDRFGIHDEDQGVW